MQIVQVPLQNFAAMTLAAQKRILLQGENVDFVDSYNWEKEAGRIFYTVGGRNGRGYAYKNTGEKRRFVIS